MEIDVTATYQLPELAARWTELESRADGGFFLSWRWIGTWLHVTGARPLLIEATLGGVPVALGLLCPRRRRRHLIAVNQLCLHETGLADFDSVMIEHNNFLIARQAPKDLVVHILQALQSADLNWDEIVFGGVAADMVCAAEAAGLQVEKDRISPAFGVGLAPGDAPWEDSLSANLRAQIRQSRAFAERMGEILLEPATDTKQSLDFLEQLMVLHTAYWQKRNRPGAFASSFSRTFHRELISARTESQATTELLRLSAGGQTMGYLYNFRYADRIYNYQSGFSYAQDNRHRPGLIAHAMAIEQARSRNMRVYDFLAGDARYKARLGQPMGTMLWCRAQKNRPMLRAERVARQWYRRIRNLGAKPAQ